MFSVGGMQCGCPIRAPGRGTNALLQHKDEALKIAKCDDKSLLDYTHEVWELCAALWGDLPELDSEDGSKYTILD